MSSKAIKLGVIALMIVGGGTTLANAATTAIRFPKGSYCSSFEGNLRGRTFTIALGVNQTLEVREDGGVIDRIIVKNPKGATLRPVHDWTWVTNMKGTYKITVIPYRNAGYGSLQFCAY